MARASESAPIRLNWNLEFFLNLQGSFLVAEGGKSVDHEKCRSLTPFTKPFVQIFIEFVKVTLRGDGVARLQRASEDDNAWRLHDTRLHQLQMTL